MRIYGASPLFNYVELVFRCKRLFIVAILLGTVITSAVVFTRPSLYKAQMMVALVGNPEVDQAIGKAGKATKGGKMVAAADSIRKASRLTNIWLPRQPEFLKEVIDLADVNKGVKEEDMPALEAKVRKAFKVDKQLLNGQYMTVSITWADPVQAENLLNQLYARFAEKTVNDETFLDTTKRTQLESDFTKYDREANDLAAKKMRFTRENYNYNPTTYTALLGQLEAAKEEIIRQQTDLSEVGVRLARTKKLLLETPKTIPGGQDTESTIDDPKIKAAQDLDREKKQLEALQARYQPSHPAVIEQLKKTEAAQAAFDLAKTQKAEPVTKIERTRTVINDQWYELDKNRVQYEIQLNAQEDRLKNVRATLDKYEERVSKIPELQSQWVRINADVAFTNNIRQQLRARLADARIAEARNKLIVKGEVKQAIAPKAERQDTSAKLMLLYALGPILGLVVAFCFSLLAEALDHTLRTPVEVEKFLGKPVLAVLPKMQPAKGGKKALPGANKPSISS